MKRVGLNCKEYSTITIVFFLQDFVPVLYNLTESDFEINFAVTALNDSVALEDGDVMILKHTSSINNYVDLVEATGEFINHMVKVIIKDKDSSESDCLRINYLTKAAILYNI